MHVLVPCKGLDTGKSRLSGCLGPRARRSLCERLLGHTLDTAAAFAGPGQVLIVTSDAAAAELAASRGIRRITDAGPGLNAALDGARAALAAEAAVTELLILPTDLPLATSAALARFAAASGDVVIAPDESGTGTNALLLRGGAVPGLPLAFGPGSFAAHVAAGRALGLAVAATDDWRLAFDIDECAQYLRWRASGEDPPVPERVALPGSA